MKSQNCLGLRAGSVCTCHHPIPTEGAKFSFSSLCFFLLPHSSNVLSIQMHAAAQLRVCQSPSTSLTQLRRDRASAGYWPVTMCLLSSWRVKCVCVCQRLRMSIYQIFERACFKVFVMFWLSKWVWGLMCWLKVSKQRLAWLLSWWISAYMVLHRCQQCCRMCDVPGAKYAKQGVKRHVSGKTAK